MIRTIDFELSGLRERHPEAYLEATDGTNRLLLVPGVPLPPGWGITLATVAVMIPGGYPQARLDCFYVEGDLRLASGAEPQSSGMQQVGNRSMRWFSWHLGDWNPQEVDLDRYVRSCEGRLRQIR